MKKMSHVWLGKWRGQSACVWCVMVLLVFPGMLCSAEQPKVAEQDLLPFDGTYTFGWLADNTQSHLNVGTNDFLIAFRVNPQKITRSNLPESCHGEQERCD